MNYYPFHIGDFRSGTANMGRLQRAIYRELLDICYDTEKPLPLDRDELYDAIGAESEEEQRIIERLLRFKFDQQDDGFHHLICDKVIGEYHAKAEIAKENGRKGGRPPGSKNNPKKPSGLSVGTQREPDRNPIATGSKANQEPITNNHKPEEKVNTVVELKPDRPEVQAVFDYWKLQRGHDRAKLDDKRGKAIRARLKDGYSVEDICRAIDGIAFSKHHMGQNDSGTVYDDIELICRNGPNVDKFQKAARDGGTALDPKLQHQIDVLNEWVNQG